jgi:hypothetical protein
MYAVLKDSGVDPVPECTADDVVRWCTDAARPVGTVQLSEVKELDPATTPVLVLPYLKGECGPAFHDLLTYHAAGGALLFLGDLPHHGSWYPLRNMQAPELHLTRCNDELQVQGFSAEARELLGDLPRPDPVLDKSVSALRITAYPPDRAINLLESEPGSDWPARAAVLVERKDKPFFGARLGILGFTGGEPRENAAGVYERDWTYDPGLLTREWEGLPALLMRLLDWLSARVVEGAISCRPVGREGETDRVSLVVKNTAPAAITGTVVLECDRPSVNYTRPVTIQPGEVFRDEIDCPGTFGVEALALSWHEGRKPGNPVQLHSITRRILPAIVSSQTGMGFSTYQAFRDGMVTEAFCDFVASLADMGMQYVRCNIPWQDIEPEPGQYNWRIPDQLLELGRQTGLDLQFWVFPTTRGSGLSDDGGLPEWVLKEPALDRDGNPGLFPSLGSPHYNDHYFAMLEALVDRYKDESHLARFVFDYGNSDFPYGYYYYGCDSDLFDYSEWERLAFSQYLTDVRGLGLPEIRDLYGDAALEAGRIPIPHPKQTAAWSAYLEYRTYAIGNGIHRAGDIVARLAPGKVPPDFPGHGLGSIADLSAYLFDSKARHWEEEADAPEALTRLHSAGPTWGGEAWQVGGSFAQMDDALFNSIRLNATYFTVAGPDLGLDADDMARMIFIRRALQGASRPQPRIAILDRMEWHARESLCHVGVRLDQSVALLCPQHRFDFSCFDFIALPPRNVVLTTTGGGQGGGHLVPTDRDWYLRLRRAVESGTQLLIFRHTFAGLSSHSRQAIAGAFPELFEAIDREGAQHHVGLGTIWHSEWEPASGPVPDPAVCEHIRDHALVRLLQRLGLGPDRVDSSQAFLHKELLDLRDQQVLLLRSEWPESRAISLDLSLHDACDQACDLSTGERFAICDSNRSGWQRLTMPMHCRQSRYLLLRSSDRPTP